ncbi:MAG: hypothetical protein LQ346_003443 [Caloplaca aetnensis]|nr:MAG: hypothetical protein LQ346_003443 [Caloplaca aetnensis]
MAIMPRKADVGQLAMIQAVPLKAIKDSHSPYGHNIETNIKVEELWRKEKPPEGYKALPTVSEEQGDRFRQEFDNGLAGKRERSSSSWQAKNDSGFNTKDYRDEKRWADGPARRNGLDGSEGRGTEFVDERPPRKSNAPLAIPYTTPASEFLYGHSVVSAALKFSRRKFYKLYLYNGDSAEVRGQDREVRKLALAANMEVTRVGNDWLKLMDKMSGGRPHNGYILEASPLPKLPVTSLQPVPAPQSTFGVALNHQSREEEAVNGTGRTIKYGTGYRRYPFLLLLDGIRDTGNMGAIFRSAHFLGADGIVLCTRNSAALSPVTLKAAAGAAESLPILSVDQPGSFIEQCQHNGWKFYAAVSPSSSDSETATGRPFYSLSSMGNPTQEHPCIMILGSEGEGLRWNIQKKADYLLGIEPQRAGYGELDSLNVSVAAALLCHAFLKKPETTGKVTRALQEKLVDVLGGSRGRDEIALSSAGNKVDGSVAAVDAQRLF